MANKRDSKGRFATNSNGHSNGNGKDNDLKTYPGHETPISDWTLNEMAYNNYLLQRKVMQKFIDGRRNIDAECGYPDTEGISATDYRKLYERNEIAAKVVNIMPDECWQVFPRIYESEDLEEVTEFEEALENIGKHLLGPGYFEDEAGNILYTYLHRADRLSGVGHYGAILLGIDDNKPLDEPLDLDEDVDIGEEPARQLLYLRVLDETVCHINSLVSDPDDPRNGQPEYYDVSLMETGSYSPARGLSSVNSSTSRVHWSRIIHIAEHLENNEIISAPRMRVVYNQLYNLHKVYGGSAEMYWHGAFPGLALEVDPRVAYQQAARGDTIVDVAEFRNQMENYMNSLQRHLFLPGMRANSLSPQVVDPSPQIERYIEAICIFLDIPKRIFMGSERGELSSTQDMRSWYGKVRGRQTVYVTPRIIVPFIDRLIRARVLPRPEQYFAAWPDIANLTEAERADVATKITDALVKFVQGGLEALMSPKDYLVRIQKFDEGEVDQILEVKMEELQRELETMDDLETGATEGGATIDGEGVAIGGDSSTRLNGAQITAAIDVLKSLSLGEIADIAAVDLLSGIGIAPDRAELIVKESKKIKIEPEPPPQPFGKPPAQAEGEEGVEEAEEIEDEVEDEETIQNVFCPTGKGGGIDSSCGSGLAAARSRMSKAQQAVQSAATAKERSAAHREYKEATGELKKYIPQGSSKSTTSKLLTDAERDKIINSKPHKLPSEMYHVTSGDRLEMIEKNGIKSGKHRTTERGTSRGVYLSDDPEEVFAGGDFDPTDAHVVVIDTRRLKTLRLDPEFYEASSWEEASKEIKERGAFAYSKSSIPLNAIKRIVPINKFKAKLQILD